MLADCKRRNAMKNEPVDAKTADRFAQSWNNLPEGSVYTREQFEDWMAPLTADDFGGRSVLEMGCGNGSLLIHIAGWNPAGLEGIDLGDSVISAQKNVARGGHANVKIRQADLIAYHSEGFDVVYCIGVLHHLKHPEQGFAAVMRNVKKGGRFHCWVYAREGNLPIRLLVEPLRRIFSRFPWWFTKYCVATPLVIPYFFYAKLLRYLKKPTFMPLYGYSQWIAKREFAFFRHVAFDQLVTPQTTYLAKEDIEKWISRYADIDPDSIYCILRNGNSWKFGGVKK